ncbi:hypothetical protein J8273_0423 [Carpediemonas membranifera]|uniref:Uncharacterized protein n=1 Tax=Carpediemonas membranifera TaxID=201153 RepID=A0A8J6AVG7_9EUKA|nr:hypothetical protein J8273_0423 [Carpediemonas membranifera]|eukprot:KAG9395203.1 hypothetical protein J8273_0423 [Carpediemonas membranifera]
MSFITAIRDQRNPRVPPEKGIVYFMLNIIPGLGTLLAAIATDDADNWALGIVQLCLIFVSWVPIVGPIILLCNWGFSIYWGFLIFAESQFLGLSAC